MFHMSLCEAVFCSVKPDCPVLEEGLWVERRGEPFIALVQALCHNRVPRESLPLEECCAFFSYLETIRKDSSVLLNCFAT